MKQFLAFIIISAILIAFLLIMGSPPAAAETLYVCVSDDSYLNGRAKPSTRSEVTMRLYNGDAVEAVAIHGEWVEVVGGESGTSFCKAAYLNSMKNPTFYTNTSGGRVRVRKSPGDGQGVGWISAGDMIKVTKVIMGWGCTNAGWVDLCYFTQQ